MITKRDFILRCSCFCGMYNGTTLYILLTKTTAAQNGVALIYRKMRGLYFLAVVFMRRIIPFGFLTTYYSRAHKLFGHSRVFILMIMIYVKRIIFSNDCISNRLKDRKLKQMHNKTNIYTYGLSCKERLYSTLKSSYSNDRALFAL